MNHPKSIYGFISEAGEFGLTVRTTIVTTHLLLLKPTENYFLTATYKFLVMGTSLSKA